MKEEQKRKAVRQPTITFQGKDKCVNVGKDVIRLLGEPPFVSLFLSEDGKSLAISPCREQNPLSFAVPPDFLTKEKIQLRIHSKQFVEGVLLSVGLNKDKTYRVKGTYSPEHNIVTFLFSDFQGLAKDRIFVLCLEENKDPAD